MYELPANRFQFGKRYTEDGTRYYPVNGKPCAGVTSVLGVKDKGFGFLNWYAKMALEHGSVGAAGVESRKAAKRGQDFHLIPEAEAKNQPFPKVSEEVMEFVPAWEKCKAEHDITLIHSETRVCHLGLKYAGTTDLVAMIDGIPCIGDFKTVGDSSKLQYPPYDTQRFQVEAYRRAWHQMGGGWIDGVAIIRIAPGEKYDIRVWDSRQDMDEAWDAWVGFRHCLGLWQKCEAYKRRNPGPAWRKKS